MLVSQNILRGLSWPREAMRKSVKEYLFSTHDCHDDDHHHQHHHRQHRDKLFTVFVSIGTLWQNE